MRNNRDIKDREAELAREKERTQRDKEKQQQLHNDRIKLLELPEFQRVISDILQRGGMFTSVMTGNSQTYWLSGKQDFAREIWAGMAEANQDLAFELLKPKFTEIE